MFKKRNKTASTAKTAAEAALPVHAGPGVSTCCYVVAGQPHTLSCDEVTPAQFKAFIATR